MAFSVSAFFVLFVFTRLFCARIHLRAAAAEHAAAAQASDAVSFPAIHVRHPSSSVAHFLFRRRRITAHYSVSVQSSAHCSVSVLPYCENNGVLTQVSVQVHGVPGGVRGQGRGARAALLRPRLPRRLHRHLAPAAPHLPHMPLHHQAPRRRRDNAARVLRRRHGAAAVPGAEEYEAKDVVRVLPYCGHAFHAACIDTWLRQHPTCPICRSTTKHRAAAGTMPPVYYAVAMAPPPFRAPTSSSDQGALQQADAATAAVGAEHMDVTSSRLELEIVISDESASSGATCPIATLAPPFQVPTSSSDHDALREANPATASVTAAVGTDRMDVLSTRLEIVISDEPASSDAPCQSTASEEHPCAETRRQSSQGNAWEHRQC
ncbi:RING-H2 finger protein ATL65 [Triticum urartu]|uniref:RING-H2 finger protein ATL65 n=1 Tax=Triticum urartu TaxID=4572 RepID=M8AKA4_TRIUA|nr:RING-H2 finger protein ATL65 [Triticum urartu]